MTHCLSFVSIVDFEQVKASWMSSLQKFVREKNQISNNSRLPLQHLVELLKEIGTEAATGDVL